MSTRERILLTAERLFALHGVENVTIRQINEAAGQRNTSAIYYHFGSVQKLVNDVFSHRLGNFNRNAHARLDGLLREIPEPTAEQIFRTIWQATTELVSDDQRWHYLRLSAQMEYLHTLTGDPLSVGMSLDIHGRVLSLLERALPYLPPRMIAHRWRNAFLIVPKILADWAGQVHENPPTLSGSDLVWKVDDLMTCQSAMLAAPAQSQTARRPGERSRSAVDFWPNAGS